MNPTKEKPNYSNQSKRYYWLKLGTNFFHSDDVKVILAQKGGEKYVLFWLKLLLKAVEQEEIGVLKYKSDVPYTPEVLAAITDTDTDVVRSALSLFSKLGLITTDEDDSIIIDAVHGLVGSESDSAIRMRRLRERQRKQIEAPSQSDGSMSQNEQSYVEKSREEKRRVEKREDRHRYGINKHVLLSDANYSELYDRYGKPIADEYIQKVDDYCENHGKNYTNWTNAVHTYIRNDVKRGKLKLETPIKDIKCPQPNCEGLIWGGICNKCGWSKNRPEINVT